MMGTVLKGKDRATTVKVLRLTLLHSGRPKLYAILAFLSAIGFRTENVDPKEQSDQGLLCLPFQLHLLEALRIRETPHICPFLRPQRGHVPLFLRNGQVRGLSPTENNLNKKI